MVCSSGTNQNFLFHGAMKALSCIRNIYLVCQIYLNHCVIICCIRANLEGRCDNDPFHADQAFVQLQYLQTHQPGNYFPQLFLYHTAIFVKHRICVTSNICGNRLASQNKMQSGRRLHMKIITLIMERENQHYYTDVSGNSKQYVNFGSHLTCFHIIYAHLQILINNKIWCTLVKQ